MSHPNAPHFTADERKFLSEAAHFLEKPSMFVRMANKAGQPIEKLQSLLPVPVRESLHDVTRKSVEGALKVALKTIPEGTSSHSLKQSEIKARNMGRLHTLGSAVTGSIGGLFGLPALIVELPVTTATMLRSIAENARAFGFDLSDPKVQLECMYVFTMGSTSPRDDAMETTYYSSRVGFSEMITGAAKFVAKHTTKEILEALERGAAPQLVKFITAVASKFEITITRKVLSSAVPLVGAIGGGVINSVFTHHFSKAAQYHFGILRLERIHGEAAVRAFYQQIKP